MTPAFTTHTPLAKHRCLDPADRQDRPCKIVRITQNGRQQPIAPRRSFAAALVLACDWVEAAALALLAWLGSFILTGLVHCAFAHYVGDPDLLKRLHEDQARTPPIRSFQAPAPRAWP